MKNKSPEIFLATASYLRHAASICDALANDGKMKNVFFEVFKGEQEHVSPTLDDLVNAINGAKKILGICEPH